jgi:hypothetical protein
VHRHIGKVDGVSIFLLLLSILVYIAFAISLTDMIKPIRLTPCDILQEEPILSLMLEGDSTVFSGAASKLPAMSYRNWKMTPKLESSKSKPQLAEDLNYLIGIPNLIPIETRLQLLDPTDSNLIPYVCKPSSRSQFVSNVYWNRWLFDKYSNGSIKPLDADALKRGQEISRYYLYFHIVVLILGLYRILDIFFVALSNSPIGRSAVSADIRPIELNKRLVLSTMLVVVELVFWNATIFLGLELYGIVQFKESFCSNGQIAESLSHSLQTSMSSITTIGYGTYAPNCWLSVLLCYFETLTGIVLLSFVVSAVLSVVVAPANAPGKDNADAQPPVDKKSSNKDVNETLQVDPSLNTPHPCENCNRKQSSTCSSVAWLVWLLLLITTIWSICIMGAFIMGFDSITPIK